MHVQVDLLPVSFFLLLRTVQGNCTERDIQSGGGALEEADPSPPPPLPCLRDLELPARSPNILGGPADLISAFCPWASLRHPWKKSRGGIQPSRGGNRPLPARAASHPQLQSHQGPPSTAYTQSVLQPSSIQHCGVSLTLSQNPLSCQFQPHPPNFIPAFGNLRGDPIHAELPETRRVFPQCRRSTKQLIPTTLSN